MEGIAIIALFFLYMCVKTDIKRLEWKIDRLENKRKNDDDAVQTVAAAATDVDTAGTAPASLSADALKETPAAAAREGNQTPANISAAVLKEKKSAFNGQGLTVWIAGFAAVLGFFYFVRYSIEQGLLTPTARLTITALCGVALTFGGVFIRARKSSDNSKKIGEAFIGIGLAALYFAAYALSGIYRLAPESLSFGLMCLITVSGVILTMLTNCNSGIILALIGGFLTPALKTDGGSTVVLASYLFVLTSTLLYISRRTGSFFLSLLTFCGCGFWLLFTLLSNFGAADSIVLFVLLAAVNLASGYLFSDNNEEQKNLRQIPLLFAVIFTFLMLLKTNFGFQEWSIIAVMLCGLTALCLFRRQEYTYLLITADIAVFVLLGYWHIDNGDFRDIRLFLSIFAFIALVPLYIAGWVRPHKVFLLLPATLAPFVSLLAYLVFPDEQIAFISIAAAAAFVLQILRLNLRQQDGRNLAGYLVLSAAALVAIALSFLLDNNDYMPVVLAVEILILGILRDRFAIGRLNGGLVLGAILFFACEYNELTDACRQLFFGAVDSVRIRPKSFEYYWCCFAVPTAAFTVLAFAGKGLVRLGSAAAASLLGCFGLFSLFMLAQINPGEQVYVVAGFTDNTLLTCLLLCAALPYAFNRQKTYGRIVFYIGLWRLFLGGFAHSPMFNGIPVDTADILLAYGVPFIIFAVCAAAPKGIHKDKFALAAAGMSFVLVSALMTYDLYGKLYLRSISFDDSGIFAYSALWLVLGGIWLAFGFLCRVLVKPAFALVYLVAAKVFLYDVSSLEDVWRIAALFGLAGSLFVISYGYNRWFAPAGEAHSAG